jgi:hypothetical protein
MHHLEVLHRGEGVVEVVEQMFPLPVLLRPAKSLDMVLSPLLSTEEDVAITGLDAALQLVGDVSEHR